MKKALLVFFLLLLARSADADMYFNSSEPGCDGSNPNYRICDDFEDGNWAYTYSAETNTLNDGWNMTPYSPGCPNPCAADSALLVYDAAAPQYAYCGGVGVAGTSCTADTGPHNATQGQAYGMGMHSLSSSVNVTSTGIYVRLYTKPSTDYIYWAQKSTNFLEGGGGIDFASIGWPFNFGELLCSPILNGGGYDPNSNPLCRGGHCPNNHYLNQNVGPASNVFDMMQHLGNWIFIEAHIKGNTANNTDGIFELWMDDCGANGLGCTGTPTLRSSYNNVEFRATTATLTNIWFENWANPGPNPPNPAAHELLDQIIVSTAGPIGFMGAAATKPPAAPLLLSVIP